VWVANDDSVCWWWESNGALVVTHPLVGGDELPAPDGGEVFELGIGGADEVELLFAAPAFELGFAGDGFADVFVLLVVEEARAVVLLGEAFVSAVLMFPDAAFKIASYTDVERAGEAAHDVGVAGFHAFCGALGFGFVVEEGSAVVVMVAASGFFGCVAHAGARSTSLRMTVHYHL